MAKKIRGFWSTFSSILKEANEYSINRVLPFILFSISNTIFWGLVIGVFFFSYQFNFLGELATVYLSVQTLIAGWLTGNKFTNSKYNTDAGSVGKPLNNSPYDTSYTPVSQTNATSQRRGIGAKE